MRQSKEKKNWWQSMQLYQFTSDFVASVLPEEEEEEKEEEEQEEE